MRPSIKDYAKYYHKYIEMIENDHIIEVLENQLNETSELFKNFPEEKGNYSYAEGKWSTKEVLGHLTDSERVFSFRALCIARGEKQSLPGFEQDDFVREGGFNNRTLKDILEEFIYLRRSNLALFSSFTEKELNRRGIASENEVTVRAILFIIAGHGMHHIKILKEKYIA